MPIKHHYKIIYTESAPREKDKGWYKVFKRKVAFFQCLQSWHFDTLFYTEADARAYIKRERYEQQFVPVTKLIAIIKD